MIWTRVEPLTVERLTIAIADLPSSLAGIKIIQLSDFHYDGIGLPEHLLREVIAKTNQEKPDLIVLTGDYIVDNPETIYDLVLHLKTLESRLGLYAILGNHDIFYPPSQAVITEALTQIGIKVLWNEIAYPFGDHFPLIGLADFWSKEFNPQPIFSQIDPKIPRLVLCHNPDPAAILKQWRVDLQLSGHTHGGQIVLPIVGALPMLLRNLMKRYLFRQMISPFTYIQDCTKVVNNWQWREGLHQIGTNQLYINRGLGSHFPGRFFCPPELTVISLIPSS